MTTFADSMTELVNTSTEPKLLISTEETTSVDTDMSFSADYLTSDEPELTIKEEATSVKQDINTIADLKTKMITTSLKPELLMTTAETKSANSDLTSHADPVTEFV